jgi:hypothetical protein
MRSALDQERLLSAPIRPSEQNRPLGGLDRRTRRASYRISPHAQIFSVFIQFLSPFGRLDAPRRPSPYGAGWLPPEADEKVDVLAVVARRLGRLAPAIEIGGRRRLISSEMASRTPFVVERCDA